MPASHTLNFRCDYSVDAVNTASALEAPKKGNNARSVVNSKLIQFVL
jgi:hypothetical protein